MRKIQILRTVQEAVNSYTRYSQAHPSGFLGFYHGGLDKIILNEPMMMIHYSDRQVHRGFAVFDTCDVFNKRLYLFDEHMTRFFSSMKSVGLKPAKTKDEIRDIVCQMTNTLEDDTIGFRFWLSRGGNGLSITPPESDPSILYVVATKRQPFFSIYGIGQAWTTKVEVKGPFFGSIKTTNYLLNSMASEEAKIKGCEPIMVTEDGYVAESSVSTMTCILNDGSYYVPPYYRTLNSITQNRALTLVERHMIPKGMVKRILRSRMKIDELKRKTVEMFLVGGDIVHPMTHWDGQLLTDGIGPIAKELTRLFEEDIVNPEVAKIIK